MRDLFLEGLPILDALEVSGSTAATARWINCDQSSVSRAYRRASELLDLQFSKTESGYRAGQNLELLASLRRASQLRRLAGGMQLLQWVSHADVRLPAAAEPLPQPLKRPWQHESRSIDLLRSRVLDLALVTTPPQAQEREGDAIATISLTPQAGLSALVLAELLEAPSIQALIGRLSTARERP